jgi:tryptophan synthase alpha chain
MASTLEIISSNRLDRRLASLRENGTKALVCYVTAGFPDPDRSLELIRGLQDAGADVIEVGVPFSDPIADGPVIQDSSQRALAQGMTLDRTLELITMARCTVPVVLFSYLNPLIAAGDDLLSRAVDAGVDGLLVTDLPVGADPAREEWIGSSSLAFIRLVAPTTPTARMREIATHGSGFTYLISRLGVTGASEGIPVELAETVSRLRLVSRLPICVGFGVGSPAQAAAVGALADGVVIGSALVQEADKGVDRAVALAMSLRHALDS